MGPEREMTATDVSLHNVAQWVESCLFSPDVASREKWIRTHLASVVTILPEVTPDESFSTIRSLAYAAQSFRPEDSCLFRELGETDLWEIKNLSELCRAEQLGNLFCGLTEKQEADVPAYTPTHPKALQTVLHLSDATAVTNCIDALHRLLVSATGAGQRPHAEGQCDARGIDAVLLGGTETVGAAPTDGGRWLGGHSCFHGD
ncbi:hypothetical protein ADEAN_000840400 [Angomonas deanei]|uniref:Uncharacterized protein n=1 Tax=Angomonas deanei TaxID=59799 RepID=A0A7G2CM08_9TRYP|nr:hypothetical protein ADEAN_000840400 [Angomonas deanei]